MRTVNIYHHIPTPNDIYIGRPRHNGSPSPLCNNWTHIDRSRAQYKVDTVEQALSCYAHWLYGMILREDPVVMAALAEITEDSNLVCFCKPKPCHGDVIIRAVRWLRNQQKEV